MTKIEYINSIDKNVLLQIAEKSKSITEICSHIGLSNKYIKSVRDRLINEKFDLSILDKKKRQYLKEWNFKPFSFDEVFIENSKTHRGCIKRRIIKDNLIEYKCKICKCEPIWNGIKLVLILDHINGIRNDHRLENLRFLCPNCNSQTETFAGKNCAYKGKLCSCGNKIHAKSITCKQCSFKNRSSSIPNKHILEQLVKEKPLSKIAIEYNVSDKAVAKWCKKYNIEKPKIGYWITNK